MSSDLTGETNESAPVCPDSPQPLQLTASNSSRCTSPLSPPSDPNASASSVEEDEPIANMDLTIAKSESAKNISISRSPTLNNHISNGDSPSDSLLPTHKVKSDILNVPPRAKNRSSSHMSLASDATIPHSLQSSDYVQLLLEYRQVLLDVLAKSILLNDNESNEPNKGVVLPLKCQCGYTSKLSNQITRTSTYVHQLELRFRSLVESAKPNMESKYSPKRPWFINSAAHLNSPIPLASGKASLLEKKKLAAVRSSALDRPLALFSGNSSINSSLNGDEDDVDSDEDDVNDDNLSGSLNSTANSYGNGSLEETNGGGKTILEGYLESMKNMASEDGSDEDDKDPAEEDEDIDAATGEDESLRGPGKRIDIKTKKLVVQMQRNGSSFTNISRQIGISRKSVRRIISNFRAYGMLEKKRESRIQQGMQELILKLYSQGRSYTQISRATTVSKPTISKIIKQYIDSNIFAKGPTNGLATTLQNGIPVPVQDVFGDALDEELDEDEKDMIVDEDVVDGDDEHDIDDEEGNVNEELSNKNDIDASLVSSYSSYPKAQVKSRKNISLIHGPYNGYSQHSQASNGNRLSLIKHDRVKPYDAKMRHNSSAELLNQPQHRISKSQQPIVPPLPASANLYAHLRQQQHAKHLNNNDSHERDSLVRVKGNKLGRHSSELSIKESMVVPEADKNNNTTLANCNVTITSTSNGNHHSNNNSSNASNGISSQSSSVLPPIPASLVDGSSDNESLVPKNFIEAFPAGIMNSLNPNRATKLTLEDFNIVWQLRSQHWTHNQIRKYFQQRGKSISKSSISRIMNGKQRNFQQFFNVMPSNF